LIPASTTTRPSWCTVAIPLGSDRKLQEMQLLLSKQKLNSVCRNARCPNIAYCFSKGTVTFLVLGAVCTRNCLFCAVAKGMPEQLDSGEPGRIAATVSSLHLSHAVITSVTRDDLTDGGATHFSKVTQEIRINNPRTVLELLIPDFRGSHDSLQTIVDSRPDIIGHNIETVQRIFKKVRKEASFERSLDVLDTTKSQSGGSVLTKSGLMVGLGETEEEVVELLTMLRDARCDIVTIGQYLRPSSDQIPVCEYVRPSTFAYYQTKAMEMGFRAALSGPLVRSSFHASELLEVLNEVQPGMNDRPSVCRDTAQCVDLNSFRGSDLYRSGGRYV
jgi:lipoic acid synthetase